MMFPLFPLFRCSLFLLLLLCGFVFTSPNQKNTTVEKQRKIDQTNGNQWTGGKTEAPVTATLDGIKESQIFYGGKSVPQHAARSTMYAFEAQLSASTSVADSGVIVYDRVLMNVGGLYANTSGQFVCTDEGIYVFVVSSMKTSGTVEGMQCITALRHGATEQKYGPKTSYYDTSHSGSTEMVSVIQCAPITAVTVISKSWSDTEQLSTFYHTRTKFLGFNLQSLIAFTVELSIESNIMDGGRVMFDDVVNNFGDRYDVTNGAFRCPDDGIYVFSVSAHTTNPATPWSVSRLMKERELVVLGPITYRATASHDSGTNSITTVVQCSTGESIYVETQAAHDFFYNSYAPELTSFTGFNLYNVTDPVAVAFSAATSSNHTTTFDGQPFMFDRVISNVGGAFDPLLSVFVCPDDDLYIFSSTVTADHGKGNSFVDLSDGTPLNYPMTLTIDDSSGTSGTSTISVMKRCVTGVQYQVVGRNAQESVYLAGYNVFSGFKVPGDSTSIRFETP